MRLREAVEFGRKEWRVEDTVASVLGPWGLSAAQP